MKNDFLNFRSFQKIKEPGFFPIHRIQHFGEDEQHHFCLPWTVIATEIESKGK